MPSQHKGVSSCAHASKSLKLMRQQQFQYGVPIEDLKVSSSATTTAVALSCTFKSLIQTLICENRDPLMLCSSVAAPSQAANNSHKDILRPHPGKEIVIPQSRMLHTREKPRAVQTIGNPSASLSLTGFQSAVAANAPGIQLVAGLIAAAAFGRVLLQ
eukprot:scaffold117530_cov21-Tisochrysis_lutea.AAC.2